MKPEYPGSIAHLDGQIEGPQVALLRNGLEVQRRDRRDEATLRVDCEVPTRITSYQGVAHLVVPGACEYKEGVSQVVKY